MSQHLEGPKFHGWCWLPPVGYWTEGHWTKNKPLSHVLGGFGATVVITLLAALRWPVDPWLVAFIVAAAGLMREEWQLEVWPNIDMCSFVWDWIMVVIGAALGALAGCAILL